MPQQDPALLSEPILTDQLVAYFGMRPFTIYGSEDKNQDMEDVIFENF